MRLLVVVCLVPVAWGQNCVPVGQLRPAGQIEGALNESHCRLADGSLFAEYALFLPTHGEIELSAEPSDFPATILLRDSFGRPIDQGAQIKRTVERGEYSVIVNSTRSGAFRLRSYFAPEPATLCRTATPIGSSRSAAVHLSAASCRLPEGSAYDPYVVTVFGAGTLDVKLESTEFSGQVILRTSDGRPLASGAGSASVRVRGSEDYSIVVAAAEPEAGGSYKVSVAFTPADEETCRPAKALDGPQDVRATIEDSNCRFGDDLRFHYYPLKVTETGLADLRVTSGTIDSTLALLDADGRLLALDYESGGLRNPILRPQLSPGEYTALVIASRAGDYTLQYQFRPGLPEICPVLALEANVVAAGSLAGGSSCRGRDGMQDIYKFTLPSAGTVELILTSTELDTMLVLRDAKDNVMIGSGGGAGLPSRIVADLKEGVYTAVAAGVQPGNYTIGYRFAPGNAPPCKTQALELNGGYIADLGADTCRGADGQPTDYYEFRTTRPGTVAAFLTSPEIDGYLTLLDGEGKALRRDDNSYGDGAAMIVQHLPAGVYRLAARSAVGGERGRYRVDVRFAPGEQPSGCRPLQDLARGETIQSSLGIASCQYSDDTFANIYRLTLGEAAPVDIGLSSTRFDAYIELLDSRGNLIDADDDSGGGRNARVSRELDAGIYYVVAKSFQGYVGGEYSLAMK